jgi:nucleotide-binding universal stress UspA family protein
MQIQRVLCPIDFSKTSTKALHYAAAVARWYGADLHVLNVVVPLVPTAMPLGAHMPAMAIDERHSAADRGMREMIEALGVALPVVRPAVRVGAAVGEIVAYARGEQIDLTVMGTHGSTGLDHMLFGSVTERVLHYAPCPVLTIPPAASDIDVTAPVRFACILCACDFSSSSLSALEYGLSLAKENDGRLTLLHVLETLSEKDALIVAHYRVGEYIAERREDARKQLNALIPVDAGVWCDPSVLVELDSPARTILRVASERNADLIVMGAQGHGALGTMLFGSTTQTVVRRATCPVLTARGNV